MNRLVAIEENHVALERRVKILEEKFEAILVGLTRETPREKRKRKTGEEQ